MKSLTSGFFSFMQVSIVALVILVGLAAPGSALAQGQTFDTQEIFGANGEIIGDSIEFETNEDGKLDRLIAKTVDKPVELVSEKLNATCNLLTYDVGSNKLIAVGNPVKIVQEGVKATCENFVYYPKDGKAELTGNPIVWQKADDREVGIKGDVIKIFQGEDGKQRVIVESGKTSKSNGGRSHVKFQDIADKMSGAKGKDQPAAGAKPATVTMTTQEAAKSDKKASAPAESVKVDASNRDKIPEPAIEE